MAKKTTKKSSTTPKKPLSRKPAKAKPVQAKPAAKAARPKAMPKKPAKPAKVLVAKTAKHAKVVAPKPASKPAQPVVETKLTAKPGKNQAGLGIRELELYRDLLLAKRRELLGDVDSMEDEALRNSGGSNLSNLPIHMADMGTDNYEQEFTLGLVEKDRKLLREIHAALAKIQDGSYGICEGTGKPISKARLEAQPWTRFSIEHARKLEQRRPV